MNSTPNHGWHRATAWAVLALALFCALLGPVWTIWLIGPAKIPPVAIAPPASPSPQSGAVLIGEMNEEDENPMPTMTDLVADLIGPAGTSPSTSQDNPYGDYRLTDPDYIPKAIARGYLLVPPVPATDPGAISVPNFGR